MKLYFGNMVTTVTTLMILSLVGFVGYSISNRGDINFWGRRSLFVLAYGLIICCFAAARDGLDKTIHYTIDGSCNIFTCERSKHRWMYRSCNHNYCSNSNTNCKITAYA